MSFGYVMGANLLWRFVWAFFGNRYTRWRGILPGGPGYLTACAAIRRRFYPASRSNMSGTIRWRDWSIFAVLASGHSVGDRPCHRRNRSVLAAFGHWFAQWIAAPGVDPAAVQPGAADLIDKASYQAMRAFRQPFVTVHEFAFYALVVVIMLHLFAVVITELHEGGSITSAMFTGRKILTRRPPDAA